MDMNTHFALGRHITVELLECDPVLIAKSESVRDALLKAAEYAGAHIIESSFHYFAPQGVSGFVIISESHFSVHTWPEYNYAAVDIFTCGETISPYAGVEFLKKELRAGKAVISSDMWRGTMFSTMDGHRNEEYEQNGNGRQTNDLHTLFSSVNASALSSSLDFSECEKLSSEAGRAIMVEIAREMNLPSEKIEEEILSDGNKIFSLETERASIHLRLKNSLKAAYLELFSEFFTDPKFCAEKTLEILGAKSYKIHPALRTV